MSRHFRSYKQHNSWTTWVWFGLLLASVVLRFYHVGRHPVGMDYDQVREAYLASRLFEDFQVVVDNLMFLHLTSLRLVQLVFGLNELSIHIHAGCWFTLTLLPLYWLTRDLFGKTVARWGVILLSFSVIGFTSTRVGHIPILVPFFAFSALFAGERLLRTGHYRYAIFLGVMLGLGIFTFPAFKGVVVVLTGVYLSIGWLVRCSTTSWRSWKKKIRFGRVLWGFVMTGVVFLGTVWSVHLGVSGDAMTLQRLQYLLLGYRSNGRFVSSVAHFFRNGLQILSQALPTCYISHPHFLIPRTTGHAKALFYLSPLVVILLLIAIWSGVRIIRRLMTQCPLSQLELAFPERPSGTQPATPLISHHGIVISWRKEYDWLFALWILGGGCLFAMLSDHTAARRWIFSWFWIYPLAAAGIFWITRTRSKTLAGWLLGITLLSQMTLVYYPYLFKPWRMQGPTPAVIDTMQRDCDRGYHVYTTPMLHHWVRHYEQIVPLHDCGYDIVYQPLEQVQLPRPFAVFDIGDLYAPVKLHRAEPVRTYVDPQRHLFMTQFPDQWGFYDFRVIRTSDSSEDLAEP